MILDPDIWLQGGIAAALVIAGITAIALKRYAARHNAKLVDQLRAGENVRLMALAYQSQGKLDAAFQEFQKVPPANMLLDDLYYLALEYGKLGESKKVLAVLRQVQERKPGYRDVDEIVKNAREQLVMNKFAQVRTADAVQAAAAASAARPRFGAFEAQAEVGRGAMGSVYRGADSALGREVAIKTLPLAEEFEGAALEEARAIFFRELKSASALSHPNIVTIYDTGEAQGQCYVAMELLRGRDLTSATAADRLLAPQKAVDVAARLADALGYAHREGVVHCDVRPGNIVYDAASDTVKLTDFGLARITAKLKARSGVTLGVAAYMSPEQLAGLPADARSDIYSLGVTLHQLLSGVLPGEGALPAERVSAGVVAAIARATAQKPQERFASAEEFSGALVAAMAQAGARASSEQAAVDISL